VAGVNQHGFFKGNSALEWSAMSTTGCTTVIVY